MLLLFIECRIMYLYVKIVSPLVVAGICKQISQTCSAQVEGNAKLCDVLIPCCHLF
jgi:hypothetical protein